MSLQPWPPPSRLRSDRISDSAPGIARSMAIGAPPPVCRQKRTSATVKASSAQAPMSPAVVTSEQKRRHLIKGAWSAMRAEQDIAGQDQRRQQRRDDRHRKRGPTGDFRARPCEVPVGSLAQLPQNPGQVDVEVMGRRILAGVETGAAIMAQISQIGQVAIGEGAAAPSGDEGFAIAAAIIANIAQGQRPARCFVDFFA